MTLQDAKEATAIKNHYVNWGLVLQLSVDGSLKKEKLDALMNEAAELYASQFKSQLPIEQKDEEIVALKQELRRVIHEKDKEISALKSQPSLIEGVEREQLREAFEAGQHADDYDQWVKHNYDFDEWLATRKRF